jgi:uncharacterized protein YkwD
MKDWRSHRLAYFVLLFLILFSTSQPGRAQAITHQITLPSGDSWCSDDGINQLLTEINTLRAQNNVGPLTMDQVGMKDAELRAVQFAAYMAVNSPTEVGFNPHQGYDTTAASLGYNLIGEDLAYITGDPVYIVYTVWQDTLHLAAMLAQGANIAGVSCIVSAGVNYWTYEPGCSANFCGQTNSLPTVDSEEWAFLTLINNYRAQNAAGPLQVSIALETASQWMSNDMATNNYFSHTDSLGRSSGARLAAFNYPYTPWGENIAAGNSDAQSTFTQWQTACDPDASGNCTYAHRQNMLNPSFQVIGIARAFGASSTYGWYWTTDFGGVVDPTMSPSTSAPAISSFSPNPATIAAGQSASLTWNISGATSVSINNGVGDVSDVTSVSVAPTQTTMYTLTASNTAGSVTAATTITVAGTGGGGTTAQASMSSPVPGSSLTGANVTFQWTTGTGVSQYWLYVSKLAVGGNELYNSTEGTMTSQAVATLPTNGSTVYVRLWSLVSSSWVFNDYTYTASTAIASSSPATMSSPAPGSTLTSAAVTFQWTAGTGVSEYQLYVSKIAVGGSELFSSNESGTSQTVSGLPTDGSTLYIQLSSMIGSNWVSNNYTYKAMLSGSTTAQATMSSPAPGSTLSGSTVTFQWTAGTGATQYWLYVSDIAAGGTDLFNANVGGQTSQAVTTLPTNGSTVYVRLWSLVGSSWLYSDYTYKAAAVTVAATLSSPTPGSTLTATTVTFQWTAGTGVSQYRLYVSKIAAGGSELFSSNESGTTQAVSGLPADGSTLYVQLSSMIGSNWVSNNYTYKAMTSGSTSGQTSMSSPAPGSTLSGATVTFQWTAGTGVTQYWLYVSKIAVGGNELFNSSAGTLTSETVAGLPSDGSTIYVRLWSLVGSSWLYSDYTYKAATVVASSGQAVMTSPAPGSTLPSATVTFEWTVATGASRYWLYVSNIAIGGSELLNSDEGSLTAATVGGLPTDGSSVYVRLWSYIGATWVFNDYTYKAF